MNTAIIEANRPNFDAAIQKIADYALNHKPSNSKLAMKTARYCLMDSIACAFMALHYPACTKLLGPVVPGATMPNGGAKVPGTDFQLEPVQAAFNFGAMIRWLDFNDTWLAKEWGHPSDNLGGILMLADYINRQADSSNNKITKITMGDVLEGMIIAHEIQGVLAIENSFNQVGLDHVLLVRVASTAVVCRLLSMTHEQTLNAVSQAWIDGCALRTYRHAPNTGSRKSWAAGDATSRAIRLGLISRTQEMGYPSALTAPVWGFQDVLFKGNPVSLTPDLNTYVMENVLFKISFPAEFHAQTAVEAAVTLHPEINSRIDDIAKIIIETQESGDRIINKTGKLDNPADRDHCIQYMVAIGLLKGNLVAQDYEDDVAADPRVDGLREKMQVVENKTYSVDYLDSEKRSIANSVQVFFNDGSQTEKVEVHYPIGHKRRRDEGIPVLVNKFKQALKDSKLSEQKQQQIIQLCEQQETLESLPVNQFTDLLSLL